MVLVPLPKDLITPSSQMLDASDRLEGQQQRVSCAEAIARAPEHLKNPLANVQDPIFQSTCRLVRRAIQCRRNEEPLVSVNDKTWNEVQLINLVTEKLDQVSPLGCVLHSQLEECLVVIGAILLGLNADGDRVGTQTRMVAVVDGCIVKAEPDLVNQILCLGIVVMLRTDVEDIIDLLAVVVVDEVRRLNTGTSTASQVNFEGQKLE